MADEFGFRVLDARRKVDVIQDELRRQIGAFLAETDTVGVGGRLTCRPTCVPWFVVRSSSLANACQPLVERRTTSYEPRQAKQFVRYTNLLGETSWKLPADSVGGLA